MSPGSIWTRKVVTATTGRPAEHTREQITGAAVAVAVADGLAAVTMRRVAAEMGTGPASLYRHLATRDDLIDLMVDAAYAGIKQPTSTGDGRADLVADQLESLQFLRGRPWLVDALWLRPPTAHVGPHALRRVEALLARLARDPSPGWAKIEAVDVLDGMVRRHALAERRGTEGARDLAATAAQMLWVANDGSHPHLAAALTAIPPQPAAAPDERLARLLKLVLDGLLG